LIPELTRFPHDLEALRPAIQIHVGSPLIPAVLLSICPSRHRTFVHRTVEAIEISDENGRVLLSVLVVGGVVVQSATAQWSWREPHRLPRTVTAIFVSGAAAAVDGTRFCI
jgi:hypothetical protein